MAKLARRFRGYDGVRAYQGRDEGKKLNHHRRIE